MKKVCLDILADFFAVSVGGIEILVSLTAIDHLLFYFRECSLTAGRFLHLHLSKYSYSCSKSCKLLSFCLSFSFNKLWKIHKLISIFENGLELYIGNVPFDRINPASRHAKLYIHIFLIAKHPDMPFVYNFRSRHINPHMQVYPYTAVAFISSQVKAVIPEQKLNLCTE